MLRIAKSEARKRFSEVIDKAGRRGERVKITHYGRTLAILVSRKDLEVLNDCENAQAAPASTSPRSRPVKPAPRRRRR